MKQIKWIPLMYAVLAAAIIMGIGVTIAEKSILGTIACIIIFMIIMGLGFINKKKMRERGEI